MEQLPGLSSSPFDKEAYKPYQKELGRQFWSILGKIASLDITNKNLTKSFKKSSPKLLWKLELDYWA